MSTYLILIISLFLLAIVYKRYFPLLSIPCKKIDQHKTGTVVLDIRDYNVDANHIKSDVHIPYAYLKRFIQEIPKRQLHVIADDRLELNLGARFLMNKGFQIASYQFRNSPCKRYKE